MPEIQEARQALPGAAGGTSSANGGPRRRFKVGLRRQARPGALCLMATYLLGMAAQGAFMVGSGGQWLKKYYGNDRADILEVFGGHSEVSYRAHQKGWIAM